MSDHDLFGWDLLYKTVEKCVNKEADIVVALAHWYLIRNSNFRCVGIGDDKTLSPNDKGSELLPDGWNEGDNYYALRYVFNEKLYILLGAETEGVLILNLLDVETRNVSNLAITPKEAVKCVRGSLEGMIPNVSNLISRIKFELVNPVFTGSKKEVTTQTQNTSEENISNTFIPPPPFSSDPFGMRNSRNRLGNPINRDPLRNVGRGDLDPLGRGGGSMIFNPPHVGPSIYGENGPLPDSNIHPPPRGARFDPFGPPDLQGNRPNPNPDHMRPPDFDDFYM